MHRLQCDRALGPTLVARRRCAAYKGSPPSVRPSVACASDGVPALGPAGRANAAMASFTIAFMLNILLPTHTCPSCLQVALPLLSASCAPPIRWRSAACELCSHAQQACESAQSSFMHSARKEMCGSWLMRSKCFVAPRMRSALCQCI